MTIDFPNLTDIPSLKALWKEAFGDTDEFIDAFFRSAFSTERAICAFEEGKVASVLYYFNCELDGKKIAYLYAIATKKEYRGRGFCSLLMKELHERLSLLGYSGAILVPAGKELFAFYERLGYKTTAYIDELEIRASDEKAKIIEISAEEYAKRRREYLPAQSVIQEGECLDFLKLLVRFCAGDGFIFGIALGEKGLFIKEFLGNETVLPAIINTLGNALGNVRISGKSRPFAMYCPFSSDITAVPRYFAFAFD